MEKIKIKKFQIEKYRPGKYFIKDIVFHEGTVYPDIQVMVFRDEPFPYPPDPIIVGFFGGAFQGYSSKKLEELKSKYENAAEEMAKYAASYRGKDGRRMVLLTGACPGLPHISAKSARENNGFIVGVTGADSPKTHEMILKCTLDSSKAEELIKEQENIYNLIIFPPYKLPKFSSFFKETFLNFMNNQFSSREDLKKHAKDIMKLPSDYGKNILKWRNPLNTELCDAVVCLGAGSAGSNMEISTAYHANHSIIGLYSPNADINFEKIPKEELNISDFIFHFHQTIGKIKNDDQRVIYDNDPKRIIETIGYECEKREIFLEELQKDPLYNQLQSLFDGTPEYDSSILWDKIMVEIIFLSLPQLYELDKIPISLIKYFSSIEKPLRRKIIEPLEEQMLKWR